jgi:hypothetical protein
LSASDVGIHELEYAILVWFLCKLHSDGWRSISHKVLQLSSGNVGIHKFEHAIFVTFLCEFNWFTDLFFVNILSFGCVFNLHELLSDRLNFISNKISDLLLGIVQSIKFTDDVFDSMMGVVLES